MLPMEFGALLRSTRYPVVRVHPAEPVPGSPIRDQFLIDRSDRGFRSEEHTSELQSLMRISYAVFCLKNKKKRLISITITKIQHITNHTYHESSKTMTHQ